MSGPSSTSSSLSVSSSISSSHNMLPAYKKVSKVPIPENLHRHLHDDRECSFLVSPDLYKKAQGIAEKNKQDFCRVLLSPDNPEYKFVEAYLNQHSPPNMTLVTVEFIYNKHVSRAFEAYLEKMEAEAKYKQPNWNDDTLHGEQRNEVYERWKRQVAQFSPIYVNDKGQKKELPHVHVLPLWRATSERGADVSTEVGLSFTGSHHLFFDDRGVYNDSITTSKEVAKEQELNTKTDRGYFGNGHYFTPQAKYASLYSRTEEKILLLAWVALRAPPYPVIGDTPVGKCSDVKKLEGFGAYRGFSGHYIPVRPIQPLNEKCKDCFPCWHGQEPVYDEVVVFQDAQTLPQYIVKLKPNTVQEMPEFAGAELFKACGEGNQTFVEEWLIDETRISIRAPNGETLMHAAARENRLEIMKLLHRINEELITFKTEEGFTPMHEALMGGHIGAMELIYEKCPSHLSAVVGSGWTLLHLAAYLGLKEPLLWLLQKIDTEVLNRVTREGWTPSYVAAMAGQTAILQLLNDHPVCKEMVSVKGQDGTAPHHIAAFMNHLETLLWYEKKHRDLFQEPGRRGNTVLHYAAAGGALDTLSYLLEQHRSLAEQVNRFGEVALHVAAREGKKDAVEKLLFQSNCVDNDCRSALHVAVIDNRREIVELLLDRGMDPFQMTSNQETVYQLSAATGEVELLHLLVERTKDRPEFAASFEQGDADGKKPLHHAVWVFPKPQMVEALLALRADPNGLSKFGYTPLHWAAKHGHLESARLLLTGNANKSIKNANGDNPLDLALRWGQPELSLLLISAETFQTLQLPENATQPADFFNYFTKAFQEHQLIQQLFYLSQSASAFMRDKEEMKAMQLINGALRIALANNVDRLYITWLDTLLETIEGEWIDSQTQRKVPANYREHTKQYRKQVTVIRTHVEKNMEWQDSLLIQTYLSREILKIFKHMLGSIINCVGKPDYPFAVVALGKLGREEMLPYSPVSFAYLVKNPKDKESIILMARLMEMKLINLGETPFDLREIDPACAIPSLTNLGVSNDPQTQFDGHSFFVGTPEEWAVLQAEANVPSVPTSHTYLIGDERLADDLTKQIAKQLNKTDGFLGVFGGEKFSKKKGCRKFREVIFIKDINPDTLFDQPLDLRRTLHEPLRTCLEALALHHQMVHHFSSLKLIEVLQAKRFITPVESEQFKNAIAFLTKISLRAQLFYRENREVIGGENHLTIDDETKHKIKEVLSFLKLFYQSKEGLFVENQRGA